MVFIKQKYLALLKYSDQLFIPKFFDSFSSAKKAAGENFVGAVPIIVEVEGQE